MKIIKLIPLLLSCLLLGAHFLRANLSLLVLFTLAIPLFLIIKQQWAIRLVQLCMILGSVEWLRTLSIFVAQRRDFDQPWGRLALILCAIALFTGLSALPLSAFIKNNAAYPSK